MILAAVFKNQPVGKESRHDKSNKGQASAEKPEVSKSSRGLGGRRRVKGAGKVRGQPEVSQEQALVSRGVECWFLLKDLSKSLMLHLISSFFLLYTPPPNTHTLSLLRM